MDKTININLGGSLFQIDDEAFKILRDYLQAINNRFRNVEGGAETIDDIELRIAEIFRSQRGLAGVITKENVEAMISIIGKPEDFDQVETEPEPKVYQNQRRRMYRNPDDTIISGVCGGLGAYLNIDPVLFRVLFVLFALFFGTGFLVYVVLWIALPPARSESQKRELYGNDYHSARSHAKQYEGKISSGSPVYNSGYNDTSKVGNAINEVFMAIGRVLFIMLRIILILIGVAFVLAGFLTIMSLVMIFVFKFPNAFTIHGVDTTLIYLPDFLNYIVNPAMVPWIIGLSIVAIGIPLLALIYWGVKMIFWFRANDGAFSLAGLVIWVMTITALAIILFNEGISFAETSKTTIETVMAESPDTLYIKTDHRISDLKYDKEVSLPDKDYEIFINDADKELYIRSYLNIIRSDDNTSSIVVKKRSAGRSEQDAMKKSEELIYNCRISGDTLLLDEYFTVPSGRKWSADNVGVNLYVPEGTILKFEGTSRNLIHSHSYNRYHDGFNSSRWDSANRYWILSDEGLEIVVKKPFKQK